MTPRSMSMPAHPPSEALLTHAGALRGIARALLRDEHAADDVVQDTWVRALGAAPSVEGGLGGWLHRVADGFARKHRRSVSESCDECVFSDLNRSALGDVVFLLFSSEDRLKRLS